MFARPTCRASRPSASGWATRRSSSTRRRTSHDAAHKIMLSKTFDHATSCSSENAIVVLDQIYDQAIDALGKEGGYMASAAERTRIVERLWQDGKLNRAVIAQGPEALIKVFELGSAAKGCKFVMVEETAMGRAASVVRREALPRADRVSRQGLCRRQAHRARHPGLPGQGSLLRHPHQGRGPCARAGRGNRRCARAGQPGPHLRQRRRLRQRPAVHAVDGLRYLAGQFDCRRTSTGAAS